MDDNIFIGNEAEDTGYCVFNKGKYGIVKNNFWGECNPSSSNDQLIEWMPPLLPNWHEEDEEPLELKLTAKVDYENGKPIIKA